MRLSIALLFVAFAMPALAADSIADQASRAFAVFTGGQSQPEFLSARYGTVILKNISGKWANLNGPAPGTGIETFGADTEKFCKGPGALTLSSPDAITLKLAATPLTTSFEQIYTLVLGATFSLYTDPLPYFAALNLGPDRVGPQFDQQRAVLLSLANGQVQLYRPSEDILVITRRDTYPTILARCPQS